jgi:hypothetical protein
VLGVVVGTASHPLAAGLGLYELMTREEFVSSPFWGRQPKGPSLNRSNLYGTPTMHVYGEKLCCSSSSVKRGLVKVTKLHYRVRVVVSKQTQFDLQSVSLSYYVKT